MIRYSLRQLECVVAAAETGSVAAAGLRLRLAQPSVSSAIKKLEAQLGLQIFIRRHAQGVTPTPQGQRFIAEARNLLAQAQDLQRQAETEGQVIGGELRIGSFLTLAPAYAPRLIKRFQQLHPGTEVRLSEGVQGELLAGLREGRFDLALLYRVDLPDDIHAVDVKVLAPQVLLPANHRLARQRKIKLRDLAQDKLVLLDIEPSRTYFQRVLRQAGVMAVPSFASPSIELVRGLVGQGLGYSLLITRPHGDHSYDGNELCVRPIADEVEPGIIAVAKLASARLTRTASTFETFCVKEFKRFGRTS